VRGGASTDKPKAHEVNPNRPQHYRGERRSKNPPQINSNIKLDQNTMGDIKPKEANEKKQNGQVTRKKPEEGKNSLTATATAYSLMPASEVGVDEFNPSDSQRELRTKGAYNQ